MPLATSFERVESEETEQREDPFVSVEWWHDLEYPFIASTELIRQDRAFTSPLRTSVGTFYVTVMLPSLPADQSSTQNKLMPPRQWSATPPEASEEWGIDYQYPGQQSVNVVVKRLAFQGLIPPDEAVPAQDREEWGVDLFSIEIRDAIEQWWANVRIWIEISTGQRIARVGHEPPDLRTSVWHPGSITPIWLVSRDGHRDEWKGGGTFITLRSPIRGLTPELLAACLSLADVEPELAWTLLRDARALQEVHQYRRAVIDAATAAELAVTRLLEDRLNEVGDDDAQAVRIKQARTLGAKTNLLSQLGYPFPQSFWDDLVEKRNNAVHESKSPTREECEAAIQAALVQVNRVFPLPTPAGAAEPLVCRWEEPTQHRVNSLGLPDRLP